MWLDMAQTFLRADLAVEMLDYPEKCLFYDLFLCRVNVEKKLLLTVSFMGQQRIPVL